VWLTDDQVAELTKRKRPSAQMRQLAKDGIPFREVSGRPIVVERDLVATQKRIKKL
jgi:hypothetical protein